MMYMVYMYIFQYSKCVSVTPTCHFCATETNKKTDKTAKRMRKN